MKTINVTGCCNCPCAAIGKMEISDIWPEFTFRYCKLKALAVHKANSEHEVVGIINSVLVERTNIPPDWCPLPDSDRPSP